ncbi:MAG: hypothetical protein Q8R76_06920 [Candidatus Omnitrophota bacterium]|nr:hypothetical protein [Candidatus Omnitrophota bacterium]
MKAFLPLGSWGLVGLILIVSTGCSTMYGRQNDEPDIFFDANVLAVTVSCSGKTIETPGNIALRQSQTHRCQASKEGFATQTLRVPSVISKQGFRHSTEMNWAKWGKWTLGIGNLIGWTVDFVSGAMRSPEKDRYVVMMKPASEAGPAQKALSKTVEVTKTLVMMPGQVVDEASTVVLDKTVRTGSEGVGIAGEDNRAHAEAVSEGQKIVKYYEEESPGVPEPLLAEALAPTQKT